MEKTDLCICECHNVEHQMIFYYDTADDDPNDPYNSVYVEIHLKSLSFWDRLKYAVKYIFGHKSMYGAFDEFIFQPKDWEKLHNASVYLKKINDKRIIENG